MKAIRMPRFCAPGCNGIPPGPYSWLRGYGPLHLRRAAPLPRNRRKAPRPGRRTSPKSLLRRINNALFWLRVRPFKPHPFGSPRGERFVAKSSSTRKGKSLSSKPARNSVRLCRGLSFVISPRSRAATPSKCTPRLKCALNRESESLDGLVPIPAPLDIGGSESSSSICLVSSARWYSLPTSSQILLARVHVHLSWVSCFAPSWVTFSFDRSSRHRE